MRVFTVGRTGWLVALLVAIALVGGGCAGGTVAGKATGKWRFKKFGRLVEASGVKLSRPDGRPVTVFAPTNAAFDKLSPGTLDELLNPDNRTLLRNVVEYHVVPGYYTSDDLRKMTSVPTLEGHRLPIMIVNGELTVGGATVVGRDMKCKDGMIHAIDRVLIPEL